MEDNAEPAQVARAAFIARAMDQLNVPGYGRQTHLRELAGISPQVAQSVLKGGIPKRGDLIFTIADALKVDARQWVTGRSGDQPSQARLRDAITLVRAFERETDIDWTDQDFAAQVLRVLDDPPEVTQRAHAVVVDLAERLRENPNNKN